MNREIYQTISKLENDISSLQKKILFLERENGEKAKEINDFVIREEGLVNTIVNLERELSEARRIKFSSVDTSSMSVKEFINPTLNTGLEHKRNVKGIESEWEDIMYAFTDKIFLESNNPDLLLYHDEETQCYVSPTGNTRLWIPILQSDLDELNIISWRKPTAEELDEICITYNL